MEKLSGQPANDSPGRPFGPVWADYLAAKARFFARFEGDSAVPVHPDEGESRSDIPLGLAADVD